MESIPEPVEFEWDRGNRDKNWVRHRITNKESEEVFLNKPLLIYEDIKHSKLEKKIFLIGKNKQWQKTRYKFYFTK
jgi:uncharacterized DUF497 family protein